MHRRRSCARTGRLQLPAFRWKTAGQGRDCLRSVPPGIGTCALRSRLAHPRPTFHVNREANTKDQVTGLLDGGGIRCECCTSRTGGTHESAGQPAFSDGQPTTGCRSPLSGHVRLHPAIHATGAPRSGTWSGLLARHRRRPVRRRPGTCRTREPGAGSMNTLTALALYVGWALPCRQGHSPDEGTTLTESTSDAESCSPHVAEHRHLYASPKDLAVGIGLEREPHSETGGTCACMRTRTTPRRGTR
jgi:hypothetical protein